MHGHIFRHLEANQENLWHLMVFLFLLCGHYVTLLEEIRDLGQGCATSWLLQALIGG